MFAQANQILYTSLGEVVISPKEYGFGPRVISNIYENGVGVITFDAPLTELPNEMFFGQGELLSVTLPDGLECIGDMAFAATSITEIVIPQTVTAIKDFAFMDCNHLSKFSGKFASEDGRCLVVGDELRSIATAGLISYTIPEGVAKVGMNLLSADTDIEEIVLPSTVKSVEMSAFENYDSIERIVLNEGLEEIGGFAFNSPNIVDMTIPSTVKYMGDVLFFHNFALERLIMLPTVPPEMDDRFMLWGEDDVMDRVIVVPQHSVELYRNADCWRKYKYIIVGNEEV